MIRVMAEVSTVDDLEFFLVLARSTNLSAAAREWGVALSAVSRRLAQLERRLGVHLVDRSTRRLSLTPAGSRYAQGASDLVRQRQILEDVVAADHTTLNGTVAVHSTMGLGRLHIAPLLAELANREPSLHVELSLSDHPVSIIGTSIDIEIRVGHSVDSRLTMVRLHPNRRVICAAPSYAREHGLPRGVADLVQHNCLVLNEAGHDYAIWRFGSGTEQKSIRVSGNLSSNDGEVIANWCLEGRGLMMRSLWHVQPLFDENRLVQVLPTVITPAANIHAVYDASDLLPRRVTAVLTHLKQRLPGRLKSSVPS